MQILESDIWFDDQEFDHIDPVYTCLKFEQKWHAKCDIPQCLDKLKELACEAIEICQGHRDRHDALDDLIDNFFGDWLFSGTGQKIAQSKLNNLSYAINYRSGSEMSLALILCHILKETQFDACIVVYQGDLMLDVKISDQEGYLISPCSGQQSWYLIPDNIAEEKQILPMQVIVDEHLNKVFLGHQKWAFITENKYDEALICVELLMDILGDDPYERRDRGYLLKNIDCDEMAKSDFEFFINECPDDPAIEMIQTQLEEMQYKKNTLH